VQDSTEIVTRLIEQEVKLLGGNYSRIILGGFSQGACMSLHIGLQFPHRLAGIIALSGFLFPTTVISEVNKDTPIYIAHGELDPVIRWQLAKVSYERLKAAEKERTMFALNVESKGGHEVG
jgi:phospholipase/carboxylesterase